MFAAFCKMIKNALGRIRTYSQQIMLTSYGFRRPFSVCGLDFLFALRARRQVSTPSSFFLRLGSGLPYRHKNRLRFPRVWRVLQENLKISRTAYNVINLQPISLKSYGKCLCSLQKKSFGQASKFCSPKCKNSFTNNKLQNYKLQQRRGKERRQFLIERKGERCELCGYNKNSAALAFHHLDPSKKSFPIDLRKCSNMKLETLLIELEKCQLLCLNCRAEIHNPEFST